MTRSKTVALLASAALALAACSRSAPTADAPGNTVAQAAPQPKPAQPAPPPEATPKADILTLEGLGDLRIGKPIPAGSSFAERGMQISDACHVASSPRYPGVSAIVEGGAVRRITLGKGSAVKLAEGIGVGASEKEVRGWFGGFREEPHAYEDAPAKYLTAPGAAKAESALRFEIGPDRKVEYIHIGTMPTLAYVEGCS